jgi:hypothetical protein
VCVCVALVIQHAKRLRPIALSFVVFLALSYTFFPHVSQTAKFSKKKKVIEHKMRVLIFSTNFETFLTLTKIQRDIVNVQKFSCKVPFILLRL